MSKSKPKAAVARSKQGKVRPVELRAEPLKRFCESVGISYDTGRRKVAAGKLRAIRFGALILVPAEEAARVVREGL